MTLKTLFRTGSAVVVGVLINMMARDDRETFALCAIAVICYGTGYLCRSLE